MAFYDTTWYCNAGDQSTTGHYAVTKWAATAAIAAGALRRQLTAPAVGSERVFVCIVGGTTGSAEPTWVLTRGARTPAAGSDGTVTWMECTGLAGLNGDATNTQNWTAAKAIGAPTLGAIIKRNNGASYQICTTAGTMGAAEPSFSDTAGVTTTETAGTAVWTSLGVVGNFTGGQAPHARLVAASATNWFAVGNTIYVGDNHAESQSAGMTISPAGDPVLIGRILCHNHSGPYPPTALMAGATVSTSASGFALFLFSTNGGCFYVYGLTFKAGVGASASTTLNIGLNGSGVSWNYFDNCSFWLASTGGGNGLTLGYQAPLNPCVVILNNTSVKFGAVGQNIALYGPMIVWQNTSPALVAGSVIPNQLFTLNSSAPVATVLEGLDLSAFNTALLAIGGNIPLGNLLVKDCKLNASMGIVTSPNSGFQVQLVRCDSGAAAYKSARYTYEGAETTETSITRVGGASDPTGQAQSRKIITTANSQWLRPFKAEPYAIWNPVTGANVTVTVCGTINAGALPNNDDIWLEVEYLGSSASPLGTIVTTTKANLLAANAAVASDGSTWNNTQYANFDGASTNSANTFMTLANNNLIATLNNSALGANNAIANSASAQTTGKFYFEVTLGTTHGAANGVGIAIPAISNANINGGQNLTQALSGGTTNTNNGSGAYNLGAWAANDVICVAIDLTARKAWFRRNNGLWNNNGTADPVAGINALTILSAVSFSPCVNFANGASVADAFTANFGQSAYTQTPPTGFGNWPAAVAGWSPFKLVATLSAPQPGLAGYLHARVRAAKPSTTFYIDPQISLG